MDLIDLKYRVVHGVSTRREQDKKRLTDQLVSAVDDLLTIKNDPNGVEFTNEFVIKTLQDIRSEQQMEAGRTDEVYLRDVFDAVFVHWKDGLVSPETILNMASAIQALVLIDKSIPWVEGRPRNFSRMMLATWIHENHGKLWIPVEENDKWEQLQKIYDEFLQETTQAHLKDRWATLRGGSYDRLSSVQFPTKDAVGLAGERLIQCITDSIILSFDTQKQV